MLVICIHVYSPRAGADNTGTYSIQISPPPLLSIRSELDSKGGGLICMLLYKCLCPEIGADNPISLSVFFSQYTPFAASFPPLNYSVTVFANSNV